MVTAQQQLEDRLRRIWLHEIARRWSRINERELGGRLEPPVFSLHDGEARLGTWSPRVRALSLSALHVAGSTWMEIEETLRHEMAHQVVSELFAEPDARPHGALFSRACKMLKLKGSPRLERSQDPEAERILRRVQKLMNLASSDNAHEARAATAAANRLLLAYNLEIGSDDSGDYGYRWLGPPAGRVSSERKLLTSILHQFYFVRCIWIRTVLPSTGKQVSQLEVIGRPANLDIAEYVHNALIGHLDALWADYRATLTTARRARRSFRVGVLMGFRETLERERQSCTEQGLVWVGDPGIQVFYRRRYPRTSRMAGGQYYEGAAHQAGVAVGKEIRIRPAVTVDDEGGEKLLSS